MQRQIQSKFFCSITWTTHNCHIHSANQINVFRRYRNSGMVLSCSSTRKNSPWNFVSNPNSNWTSVSPIAFNKLPDNWHGNDFSGAISRVLESQAGFEMDWSTCKSMTSINPLVTRIAATPNELGQFTFRKRIEQDPRLLACDTDTLPSNPEVQSDACGMVTCCVRFHRLQIKRYKG